jgi:signal transduction histidine kinase/CheY-like chemotaxis protein
MDSAVPKLRLRTLLTVPFTLLILLPALVIALTSLYTGLKAVDTLSERVIADVSERVEQAAVHQLEEATITLRSVVPNLADSFDGSIDLFRDRAAIERKLFELTARARTTSYLYYGAEDGSFIGVERKRPGAALPATVREGQASGKPRQIYTANAPLDRTTLLETESRIYDPRLRPWYRSATKALAQAWTPIYVSFASGSLVTTAAQPVLSRDGKLLGALAADVELSELSSFMKAVSVSENGVAFIVDHEGFLVASSAPGQPFRSVGSEQQRIRVEESDNPVEKAASVWWRTIQPSTEDAAGHPIPNHVQTAKIESAEVGSIDVASRHISRLPGINWNIVVAIPRKDLTAPILRSTFVMFAIVVVALIAALQLGLWIVRRVTKDVELLVAATQKYSLAKESFESPRTSLRETSTLASAFTGMFERLRESLGTIRTQNDDLAALNVTLEARVGARTRQIEAQNLVLTTEVARRELLEKDLREASEAAVKQADDKARFLAMLSHELRTPLQAVIATGELLAEKSAAYLPEAKVLDAASKSVLALVDGILTYSKLEAGRVSPNFSAFKLTDVVDEAVDLARTARSAKSDRPTLVTRSFDPALPAYVRTDAGMLRQILVNLMGNAIKHAEGGEVKISLSRSGEGGFIEPAEPFVLHVAVADNGPGIPEEAKHRLFRPFEQIGRGSADPSSGSGLGLAICAMLAHALGGRIGLVANREVGTEIVFSVNAQRAESTDVATRIAVGREPASSLGFDVSLSVLLVDDHRINLRLVSQLLTVLGQKVTTAESGEEAIELLRRSLGEPDSGVEAKHLDVVLMDLNLPGISGIDAVNRMREICGNAGAPSPKFVALTASTTEIDRARCELAGMSLRVTKPATLATLGEVLKTITRETMKDNSTASANNNVAQMLDENVLKQLRALEHKSKQPFVGSLVEDYLSGLGDEFAAIAQAIREGNEVVAFKTAHALAGASLAVGASVLAHALKPPQFDAKEVGIASLESCVAQTRAALNAWLREQRKSAQSVDSSV